MLVVELFGDVPSVLGPRPVWLAFLNTASEWQGLVKDDDWHLMVERQRRPFGLFTVSSDPRADLAAWSEFSDYCVERELMLAASWGVNSTLLDDLFDEAAVMRSVEQLAGSVPQTSWHDDEPLEEALAFFLGSHGVDLRGGGEGGTEWVRVVIVVGEGTWRDELRSALVVASSLG
jgi:hypothetical protein